MQAGHNALGCGGVASRDNLAIEIAMADTTRSYPARSQQKKGEMAPSIRAFERTDLFAGNGMFDTPASSSESATH
jgi:hypothetical protein